MRLIPSLQLLPGGIMLLYLSLSAYGGVSTREALTVFYQAGIRHVELAIGPKPDNDTVEAIFYFQQKGMVYRAHHAFVWGNRHYPFNLANSQKWNYFEQLTDWLANLGVTAYSVHAGSFPTGANRASAYAKFLENVHHLHQICLKRGITFGVETMYPTLPNCTQENLLDNEEELTRFCQDAPEIKIVLDLAHLNIWRHFSNEAKSQWLKITPDKILEIHISDNDGRQDIHSRITRKTWWVSQIAQFPTGIPIILESRLNKLSVLEIQQEYNKIAALISTQGNI